MWSVLAASKVALSTVVEALQKEVAPLVVQLGHFRTPFLSAGHRTKVAGHINDYDPVLDPIRTVFDALMAHSREIRSRVPAWLLMLWPAMTAASPGFYLWGRTSQQQSCKPIVSRQPNAGGAGLDRLNRCG
ncbi:Short chain type dehydrogenase, putative [Penicillium digitatum]|uniref:Short chain type dehydrogenase, putative n=3 Tax=Penicillium digitatum TaxID=36651 RepID=K9GQG0_PEND2|nr:Short chain type dehydrogenase, putative [Penicillium digitatum Pd1]EKV10243.1 Short chain type dehydrogenase, putative [Penicillium digitatum Pd1]EKV15341.1 Short chain type dehydrogenase, putative [Penicillium digitatum PHI26]KAG0157399.1 hypothetical protein PDIDSM_4584 [Penicillium digitatum]QQK44274.1 Short chain type dehydrogenase, putative [Penicillium digitatum]